LDSEQGSDHDGHPAWRTVFDLNQEDAATTRRRLLDRAAAGTMNILAYHFPFTGLGKVTSTGDAWRWEAL